jgi:ATP-dependent helicase/nuclease subunit B
VIKPFLQTLAEDISQSYDFGETRIAIILPNRRAGLFMRRYLARAISKPIWAPDILAIEDFIRMKSGFIVPDQMTLLFNLYKAYAVAEGKDARPFDEFMPWGNMLLADFDEVDRYMVNAEDVFSFLSEAKAIENWNLGEKELTPAEKQYIRFYNSLAGVYKSFTSSLISCNLAYHGLVCRLLAESVADVKFDEWDKIIFAGFNALSTSEKRIIGHLLDNSKAEIRWDADEYYMEDDLQEAGRFLRGYKKSGKFGEMKWISQDFASGPKKINVIGVPQQIGQAKMTGQILSGIFFGPDALAASDTAVVLADENLLMPVLNSLPANCSEMNVTMGYPLRFTAVASLVDAFMNMAVNTSRYSRIGSDNKVVIRFSVSDLTDILLHPNIRQIAENSKPNESIDISQQVVAKAFITVQEARKIFSGIHPALANAFEPFFDGTPVTSLKLLRVISDMITVLRDAAIFSKEDDNKPGSASLDLEYLYHFAVITNRLRNLLAEMGLEPGLAVMQSIIKQVVASSTVPFYGEPLKGLQVMGVLETRTVDFKNIIMLSANEGLLPGSKLSNSFLPADIRNHYGLPGYKEKNAIFAYHFYRLMQRCENAWLIYNTESDELGGGEKSRFITQMIHELPLWNPAIAIEQVTVQTPISRPSADFEISIPKSPAILKRLSERAANHEKGFSPSRLNIFLTCSLQFYFTEILGIRETDEVDDTIDAMQLGTVVHKVLEQMFSPYLGISLSSGDFSKMKSNAEIFVEKAFSDVLPGYDFSTGKNALLLEVAKRLVINYIKSESDFVLNQAKENRPLRVMATEHKLHSDVDFSENQDEFLPAKVYINGIADRIDLFGETVRIIDYKTGSVDEKTLKLDTVDSMLEGRKQGMSFQLLTYAWLFSRDKSDLNLSSNRAILSGIAGLRSYKRGLQMVTVNGVSELTEDHLNEMTKVLKTIFLRLFDAEEPFEQTKDNDSCKYCTFKTICNR